MDNPSSEPARPRWRTSALLFSGFGFIVFGINLAAAIWATTNGKDGIALVSNRSCESVKTQNTLVHLLVNVLSSVLLAGSNYCMQALTGPTRQMIDKAHGRNKWLDIGTSSLRNFRSMGRKDKCFWLLICMSSLPLHLFYNSVVFASRSTVNYKAWGVTEKYLSLLDSTPVATLAELPYWGSFSSGIGTPPELNRAYKEGRLTQLSPNDCIDAYARPLQTDWAELLIVLSGSGLEVDLVGDGDSDSQGDACTSFKETYQWVCDGFGREYRAAGCQVPCEERLPTIRSNSSASWKFLERDVEYCLALHVDEHCKFQACTTLLWLVAATSLLKAVLFSIFAVRNREKRILTVGDAISTFLETPDASTEGAGLLSAKEIRGTSIQLSEKTRPFSAQRQRGLCAASARRWGASVTLYSLSMLFCLALLGYGIASFHGSVKFSTMMSWGLGSLVSRVMMDYPSGTSLRKATVSDGLILMSMVANSPQVLLSIVYFTYNGLFTSISAAREWSSFAHERKGLRVSSKPAGDQRSAYFLQLPFRYSIPLISLSIFTHWVLGQSFFLFHLETYRLDSSQRGDVPVIQESDGTFFEASESRLTTGWSPLGLLLLLVSGTVMALFLAVVAWRKLPSSMPVVGSCSLAMSAACHTIPYEPEAWKKKLTWGVKPESAGSWNDPGHCSFTSSLDVGYPVDGQVYR
ncbi:hypothetical protein QBC37DRAFT_299084 [Rhypophila decipiens]|uniref:DUF6536 domain-containing protein n=1 Tax=Rhypophila decipiens TaxID=261697 RepID=A0AAN6XZC1_9PEZI|nr:hypothetical protein QBC37DRAFT_299084 [Rhypophila decipiens]